MTEEHAFLAALDLPDATARAAFLDETCGGDAGFRRQVEALLAAHFRSGEFLDVPAAEQVKTDSTHDITVTVDGDAVTAEDEPVGLQFLTPSVRPDSLGRLGHYEVLEVLGKGGFGIVFRAFDETLQRVVAIKVLAPQLAATSPARKRFLREARASARVRHENVVQVYAVEEHPLPYLVMEFIPGETLQQRLNRLGPLEPPEVVRIGRQVAEGLAAAHATGLIHRDIKPANILIEAGPHPHARITDFGLARAADDASISQSGVVAGTPMYMAPEQARGDILDHRADLFSLGSVLYAMCSGRPPFRANSTLAVLKRVAEDTPRPIREVIPEVPPWLCDVIARLHAKNPDDRIGTAREVADLLERGPAGVQRPGHAPPPAETPEATPALRRPRPHTRRWATAAAVLLAAVAGLGFAEASGVTDVRGTVIRLFSPEGTLVVEVDDPDVSITIDGSDLVITGAGAKEIRLKPGSYTVEARKDGKLVSQELIRVAKNGRQVVRVSQEAVPPESKAARAASAAAAWERAVAAMPADEQVKAFIARLKQLNPGFDGRVQSTVEGGVVTGLAFQTEHVSDISPVRAFAKLRSIDCCGVNSDYSRQGLLIDLSPLKGLPLTSVRVITSPVFDLSPLKGMALTHLNIERTRVSDLTPLKGMPLRDLNLYSTPVSDLTPLKGMPLQVLQLLGSQVSDLSPLKGMPLEVLYCAHLRVPDFSPLKGMPLRVLWGDCPLVSDLSPLKGMPLEHLGIGNTQVADLSPLKGMPLQHLGIRNTQVSDVSPLEGLPLTTLDLRQTKVAAAAIDGLKKTLPKCRIEWDGG